jgi:hypothetical protein
MALISVARMAAYQRHQQRNNILSCFAAGWYGSKSMTAAAAKRSRIARSSDRRACYMAAGVNMRARAMLQCLARTRRNDGASAA